MLELEKYYEIFIYNNEIAAVEKIDYGIYNYFKDTFEYVYHTEYGDTYPLHENTDAWVHILIVDYSHLHELLQDLIDQGFCDNIKYGFIDDCFKAISNQHVKHIKR